MNEEGAVLSWLIARWDVATAAGDLVDDDGR
jgi:hypothetical protein